MGLFFLVKAGAGSKSDNVSNVIYKESDLHCWVRCYSSVPVPVPVSVPVPMLLPCTSI